MLKSRRLVTFAASACLIALAHGAGPAHAESALDRWASPDGTATATCTQDDPCDIVTAINAAPAGSIVHLESGNYGTSDTPLTTQLEADAPITIEAATPADPPVITANTTGGSSLVTYQSSVSDLVIMSASPTSGLYLIANSTATRVAVYATSGVSGACSLYDSSLSDSVCSQTADGAPGLGLSTTGTGTTTDSVTNVTAVSTGLHGAGVDSVASGGTAFHPTLTNSIIEGKQHDLKVSASAGATSTIAIDHSLYRPSMVATNGATVNEDASNLVGRAKFVDLATGNFHEEHTSPSIDVGAPVDSGDLDLARSPRTLGKATDIGAYEFLPRPHVSRLKLDQVVRHTATFTVAVNPEGLGTTLELVARHKLHVVTSRSVDVGNGRQPRQFTLTFRLDPETKYHVRARATNQAGVTQSLNTHFMT